MLIVLSRLLSVCVAADQHSARLTTLMNEKLLLSEVASLGQKLERIGRVNRSLPPAFATRKSSIPHALAADFDELGELMEELHGASSHACLIASFETGPAEVDGVIDPEDRHPLARLLSGAQKSRIEADKFGNCALET